MKKSLLFILIAMLCSLGTQSLLWGQSSCTVPIYVQNGTDKETLWVGVDPSATYGIDAAMGEQELPPTPPTGVFDARLVDVRTPGSMGQGLSKDVRTYGSDCQTDTFKIKFQTSTEGGSNVTLSWDIATLEACGCGRWRLSNSLGLSPLYAVDMLSENSASVSSDDYTNLYILKGDGTEYRTFSYATLALDGYYDAKGKKIYKSVKKTSNQVEFCVSFKNNDTVTVNDLHVDFKVVVDSESLSWDHFTTASPTPKGKNGKWDFTGGSVAPGESVTVCGYGVKAGTKQQEAPSWYWTIDGTIRGKKQKTKADGFSKNIIRLPMPNTINAGEEAMIQGLPQKTDLLIVGTTSRTDTLKYVQHKKYSDVLKSLVKDAGKVGKQKLQDTLATYFNNFDDAKK
ncbi:MAG: hypothetical protein EPO24_05270, partial [Bacteroidetes bacterium]